MVAFDVITKEKKNKKTHTQKKSISEVKQLMVIMKKGRRKRKKKGNARE